MSEARHGGVARSGNVTIELKMLAGSIVLGLAYVLMAALLATAQRGVRWNAAIARPVPNH